MYRLQLHLVELQLFKCHILCELRSKEFLAMHFAFDEFSHTLWRARKPIIVTTDKKALTRTFQARQLPAKVWNFCDRTLKFNIFLAYLDGTENLAAEYLSRSDTDRQYKIQLTITDSIPVYRIDIEIDHAA